MKVLFCESLPYESDFRVGSHHYASRFAADGWDVMWLSHPISPLHLLHPVKRELDERMRGWRKGPLLVRDGITYYSPFTLLPLAERPLLRGDWVAERSALVTVPALSRVVRSAGFGQPDLIWLTNPIFEPLASQLEAKCRVVRVADATAKFAQVPAAMQALEDRAIERADIVFAVSAQEAARISRSRAGVVRLPNGVEYAHFAQLRDEPADLAAIPHPRVVYVGAIEYWFDAALVVEAAREWPSVHFVLIGPAHREVPELERLGNVHLLGTRPYGDVPAYMQHCDVAIVPFARDEMVDAIHPIKVYEYLAASLPVVATRWPELEAMRAPVALAGRGNFLTALGEALEGDVPFLQERLRYARANSWDTRFGQVMDAVRPCIGRGEMPA